MIHHLDHLVLTTGHDFYTRVLGYKMNFWHSHQLIDVNYLMVHEKVDKRDAHNTATLMSKLNEINALLLGCESFV
jgi:hypothetical protein